MIEKKSCVFSVIYIEKTYIIKYLIFEIQII